MNIFNRFISPPSETQSQDVTAIYEWAKYWGHLFNSLENKAPKILHQFFLWQKLSNRWSFNISYDTRWCFMCSHALLNSYFKKFWFMLKKRFTCNLISNHIFSLNGRNQQGQFNNLKTLGSMLNTWDRIPRTKNLPYFMILKNYIIFRVNVHPFTFTDFTLISLKHFNTSAWL